jgi:cytochrome oxidase Cu insertion factor (SCO1/SenC/PrrC family)
MCHHKQIMPRLIATLLMLVATVSCSDAPPAQQAATEPSVDHKTVADASLPTQSPESSADKKTARIDVGDTAPKFSLKDQTGTQRSLDELLADGNVALIFYRSADW